MKTSDSSPESSRHITLEYFGTYQGNQPLPDGDTVLYFERQIHDGDGFGYRIRSPRLSWLIEHGVLSPEEAQAKFPEITPQ